MFYFVKEMRVSYLITVGIIILASCQRNERSSVFTLKSEDTVTVELANQEEPSLSQFIGRKYKRNEELLPIRVTGGGLLNDDKYGEDFAILLGQYDDYSVFFLEKLIRDTAHHAEILDGVAVKLERGEYIAIQLCEREGVKDSEIVAMLILEDKEFFEDVKKAWRADRNTGKIEEVDSIGIRCMNEGYE